MNELLKKLDNLYENALNLKDFMQTIRDAIQHNADEVQDGTHVLSAINYLLAEFEKMTENIENLSQIVLFKKIRQ